MSKVVVIDYGIGNLLSVTRALAQVGAEVELTTAAHKVASADRLVLPGVGAFGDGMRGLTVNGLVEAIRQFAATGRPFLGICLGMQMMLDSSVEFGSHEGLGLIPGAVVPVPPKGADGTPHKIPHVGWNALHPDAGGDWAGTLLDDVPVGAAAYFIHSFMADPLDRADVLSHCLYDEVPLTGMIRRGNLYGCQFHPEKSGPVGLRMLSNFLRL